MFPFFIAEAVFHDIKARHDFHELVKHSEVYGFVIMTVDNFCFQWFGVYQFRSIQRKSGKLKMIIHIKVRNCFFGTHPFGASLFSVEKSLLWGKKFSLFLQ